MMSNKQETQIKSRQESSYSNRWILASFMGIINGIILGYIAISSKDRLQLLSASITSTSLTTFIYGNETTRLRGSMVISFICWFFFTSFFILFYKYIF